MSTPPTTLDLRGYKCPLPVLKARKAIYGSPKGSSFVVYVSDPKAPADFQEFCTLVGYTLAPPIETEYGHELRIYESTA